MKFDKLVKSPKTVMPDLISLPRTAIRGHPETPEITGFLLEFIPHLRCGAGMTEMSVFRLFAKPSSFTRE
ncbi:MAG: hypothetical protein JRJ03_08155 [Deltaproteobacteria bacterium]|nr:hypothetical protein [Deltaproteobacteria bacterium]